MLSVLLVLFAAADDTHVQHGLRVPAGFEVVEYADSTLANDIWCLTIDPKGRIGAAGRGYIRILVDEQGDGRADRAIDFSPGPKDGVMGMLWEKEALYVTGDGGLRRYRDADGDDRADGPSELIRAMKTGGEHTAHAIHRGPDGWLYVLCGDGAGIDRSYATLPTSPVKEPIGGCVLRFTPDLKHSEIVAHGFRNPYAMDFDRSGELYTYDSDNERCVSLPWYEPTRFYHVIPGGHHGWLAPQRGQFWRLPPYFPDVIAPVARLGRGSPTGCVCYRHAQFPFKYRGGFFLCDWTFGRVYFMRPGQYAEPEVFLQSVGDNGFAPTAAVVHPETGDLFLAIGGRGTRGAIYRIRHPEGFMALGAAAVKRYQMQPRSLEWRPEDKLEVLERTRLPHLASRAQAVELIARHPEFLLTEEIDEVVKDALANGDMALLSAARRLVASLPRKERARYGDVSQAVHLREFHYLAGSHEEFVEQLDLGLSLVTNTMLGERHRMLGVRLMQLAVGERCPPSARGTIWEGYRLEPHGKLTPAQLQEAVRECRVLLGGQQGYAYEVARFLAFAEDDNPESLRAVLACLGAETHPVRDLHFLTVLARLGAPRSAFETQRVAETLLALDRKISTRSLNRDRNWPLRVAELHLELARKDAKLNEALLAHAEFGRADHVLFTQCAGFDRPRAADLFLKRATANAEFAWNAALVTLLNELPEGRALPVWRSLWPEHGLREALLEVLARRPEIADREKFLSGLASPQLATVGRCLQALEKMIPVAKDLDLLKLVLALRRLGDGKEEAPLRRRLAAELQRATSQKLPPDGPAWSDWLARAYPALAPMLEGPDGVDRAAWEQRLAVLPWDQGQAANGQRVFERQGCASCHWGAQALGPDLRGSAQRFSRADLFTAILQPSRDVPPRYQTLLVATDKGQLYQGAVIYEAVDSLILQTGPTTTVRVPAEAIASRRSSSTSLMPAGLLDKLADREIADLYAYLRSLRASEPRTKEAQRPE